MTRNKRRWGKVNGLKEKERMGEVKQERNTGDTTCPGLSLFLIHSDRKGALSKEEGTLSLRDIGGGKGRGAREGACYV